MNKTITMLMIAAALAGNFNAIAATKKEKEPEKKDTAKVEESKFDKIVKKQSATAEGMFTLRLSDGKVYFEIPDSLLGREFLMGSTIKSISDNANGIVGAKTTVGNLRHITFTKRDSTLLIREVESEYIGTENGIANAVSKSNIGPIIKSVSLAARNADKLEVYDLTDLFLSDDKKMGPFLETGQNATKDRNESFKKGLSYISDIKSFEDNLSVTSTMSYTYSIKSKSIENEPLTAVMTCSLLLLPEEIYHPRKGDYRIGYFHTDRQQLGSVVSSSHTVYFANRWRLEPSDTAAFLRGELVEPVKPIVFYIDSDFPEWWKPYIHEAVRQWQEPFEKAGFKNAIIAKDFPTDDPAFDPDNIKYSCIRYAPIGIQNAMGPSWVDPRSGEIINASVYVYHDIIKLLSRWMFVQTSQADERIRHTYIPQEILGDGIRYVIAHEVGHCLGLMHNMSGSSVIPVESLRDPKFTQENGTTTSIMDYARFNYVAQPGDMERGVKLTPPRFGKYDYYAIRWGYTPVIGAKSQKEEDAITAGWITDSLKAESYHKYGKQQMYTNLFDPRNQNEDLGDDAVEATRYGVRNLKYIMQNFMDWAGDDDDEYKVRLDYYNGIINQYLTYSQHVLLNVGGLYKNEVKSCDEMPPFQNIPREKQLKALDYMFTLAEDLDWVAPESVINRLPIVGSPERSLHKAVQNMILMTPFLASKSDGVMTKELSSGEIFDILFDRVWGPTKKGRKLTDAERDFEQQYVTYMMTSAGYEYSGQRTSAFAEDAMEICPETLGCRDIEGCSEKIGVLTYSPISGYEWTPRSIFNQGDITQGTIYGELCRVHKLVKAKSGSGSKLDQAHYRMLADAIEKGLGL